MEIIKEQIYKNGIGAALEILEDDMLDKRFLLNEISCLPEFLINFQYSAFMDHLDQALKNNTVLVDQIQLATIGNEINLMSVLQKQGVDKVSVLCADYHLNGNMKRINNNVPPGITAVYSSLASLDMVLNNITYLVIGFCRSENYSLLTMPQAKIIKMLRALHASAEIVMIDPITDQTGYIHDSPEGWEPICNERFNRILTPAGVKHTHTNFSQGDLKWQY